MKRRLELFLIILLPILGIVFLGGKIMTLTKRPEQKITTASSKKVIQKSEEEINGLTTPEYYMNVFGRINHIENSGWGVDIPINDDQSINMREMFMLHEPTIGGKPIS